MTIIVGGKMWIKWLRNECGQKMVPGRFAIGTAFLKDNKGL